MGKKSIVGAALQHVLPDGSSLSGGARAGRAETRWAQCPDLPTDAFAAVGYLLKKGGVMGFFEPSPYAETASLPGCRFVLSLDERSDVSAAGKDWRRNGKIPDYVQTKWSELIECWNEALTPESHLQKGCPGGWWKPALLLAMSADTACARLVRDEVEGLDVGFFDDFFQEFYHGYRSRDNSVEPPPSLCLRADPSVVCVLPKVRVAPVGATLNNLTRNLSLLPGRGEVRCAWFTPVSVPEEDLDTLDILLIPVPERIDATDICPNVEKGIGARALHHTKPDWETFSIKQNWIGTKNAAERFIENCLELLREARKHSAGVNGVILPEYALTYQLFDKLSAVLKKENPALEFVVSGTSDNCREAFAGEPEKGNHVLTRVWQGKTGKNKPDPDQYETVSRLKHHRWRLDRSQVETYALSPALNPKISYWWEDTPLGMRKIYFHRFRKRSVFSVLICEELARSDPCHAVLRSVAPNLIFALLMDGPQIRERWPAQYASNLADDPGSSVLTFTSFGLIDRANRQGHYKENRSVAMWKDDSGKVVQLGMPDGDGPRAVLLSLWSEHVIDRTITGKKSQARSWRYSSHFPISLSGSSGLGVALKPETDDKAKKKRRSGSPRPKQKNRRRRGGRRGWSG